jgi:hypothetical protein
MIPENMRLMATGLPANEKTVQQIEVGDILSSIREMWKTAFEPWEPGVKGKPRKIGTFPESVHSIKYDLTEYFKLADEDIERYFIFHVLDTFSIADKVVLLNSIPLSGSNESQYINEYFQKRQIDKWTVLYNKTTNANEFYERRNGKAIKREKETFENALSQDKSLQDEYNRKFYPRIVLEPNEIIGFMGKIGDKVVFKIRDNNKNNKGLGIGNANREPAVEIMNAFFLREGYTKQYSKNKMDDKLNVIQLATILEMVMRHRKKVLLYDSSKKNG